MRIERVELAKLCRQREKLAKHVTEARAATLEAAEELMPALKLEDIEAQTPKGKYMDDATTMTNSPTESTIRNAAPAIERHYSVAQVADLWGWSESKVRDVFRDEPGVLQSQLRTLRPRKRQKVTLRIPESVLFRVHERMCVAS